jgi:hypothetical protein
MAVAADKSRDQTNETATATLSQLAARILNQLALSAWLPSAALVLIAAYVLQLASVLDEARRAMAAAAATNHVKPPTALTHLEAVTQAFDRLGGTRAGGIVLMLAAVVVLTMLTQAFTFESIRFLEGYWSTIWPIEQIARVFCAYFRWRRRLIESRMSTLTNRAWKLARRSIKAEQEQIPPPEPHLSKEMIEALGAQVLNERLTVSLTKAEIQIVSRYPWTEHAPIEFVRRLTNLDKRLDDYPSAAHMQPTRLGNVLRHFEDETAADSVESLVEEVFDQLPFSLQLSHDEQRGRLDLYCSMTFVWLFVAGIAVVRLGWGVERSYCIGAIVVGLLSAEFTYRAAVASARYYGALLVQISGYRDALSQTPPTAGRFRRFVGVVRSTKLSS